MDVKEIKYDYDVDSAYIYYSQKKVHHSYEFTPEIIIDFDENGDLIGIELLNVTEVIGKTRKSASYRENEIPMFLLKKFAEKWSVSA